MILNTYKNQVDKFTSELRSSGVKIKAFVKLLGFFTVSVLPLAGLALINWIMNFIF